MKGKKDGKKGRLGEKGKNRRRKVGDKEGEERRKKGRKGEMKGGREGGRKERN